MARAAASTKGAGRSSAGSQQHQAGRAWQWRALLGAISTVLWMFLSTALIVANKRIYAQGFSHPFFVTGMGQVFSALGGLVLVQVRPPQAPVHDSPCDRAAAS